MIQKSSEFIKELSIIVILHAHIALFMAIKIMENVFFAMMKKCLILVKFVLVALINIYKKMELVLISKNRSMISIQSLVASIWFSSIWF